MNVQQNCDFSVRHGERECGFRILVLASDC